MYFFHLNCLQIGNIQTFKSYLNIFWTDVQTQNVCMDSDLFAL